MCRLLLSDDCYTHTETQRTIFLLLFSLSRISIRFSSRFDRGINQSIPRSFTVESIDRSSEKTMQRQSPPKHRHDGTSPLPLGMDWSPPPKKWFLPRLTNLVIVGDGRDSIWPHDPRTGWSYCVTIPSWIIRSKLGDSEGVAFYKVQVGIQSPEGITSVRGVLRRFSDFMKLLDQLKRTFPRKHLPPAPSKHVLRINSNKSLPEEKHDLAYLKLHFDGSLDIRCLLNASNARANEVEA
ncbi:hypothetical protein Scep_024092 [Stephania cephalantha]|uniref:PX domain-containing protein n=1 Tax=Stephania cephalantha TaxID=152367 RepID=A0AAP0HWU0_9MAGN